MKKEEILFEEVIPGGWNWSHNLKAGTALRLVDLEGGANASALFYNAHNTSERYNMADTLKAQFISFLTKGRVLYSDMGRILVSVIEDSVGWHDAIGGVSHREGVQKQYGVKDYQEHRNDYLRNGRDGLLDEIMKYGMGLRDLVSGVNFFSKVQVDDEGNLKFIVPHSQPGAFVDLQAEMDTLVVLNTCPHPLNPSEVYRPGPVKVQVWESALAPEKNPCRTFCEQNERGFHNTLRYRL